MTQRTLLILTLVAVSLGVVFYLSSPNGHGGSSTATVEERRLFDDYRGETIEKIRIEQGKDSVDLEKKDGRWTLPARSGYPADGGKVESLQLKLFDLGVSQEIPSTPDSLDKLGLSDEAIARGSSRVTFLAADGREIAGVRIGESRKVKDAGSFAMPGTGQFVRRTDQTRVYLLALPVSVTATLGSWLDTNIVNVLPANLQLIRQFGAASGEVPAFELERASDGSPPAFTPKGSPPAGKELQMPAVSQLRSALENTRISDVLAKDSDQAKAFTFDMRTVFITTTGLVYTVETAKSGDKVYAKFHADFDASLAKPAVQPSPSPSPSTAPEAGPIPSPSAAPVATPATKDDAESFNRRFEAWVFELPAYQATKLRQTIDDLFKAPAPAPSPIPGAAAANE